MEPDRAVQEAADCCLPHEARGEAKGEARLSRLISHLLSLGKTDEILSATKNDVLKNQLYEKYSIV